MFTLALPIDGLKRYLWAGFVIFCAFYISVTLMPFSKELKTVIQNFAYLIPPLLAVIGPLYAFKIVEGAEKRFWLSLMLANVLLLTGEVIWGYYEVIQKLDHPPYPSWADYSYLSAYLFFFLVLISMANFSQVFTLTKLNYILNLAMAMIVSFTFFWFFLLKPLYKLYPDVGFSEQIMNIIYPSVDLAIIFGILINISGFKRSSWNPWEIFIAFGLVATGIADIFYNYFSATGTYSSENLWAKLLDLVWATGYFLFFVAAAYRIKSRTYVREPGYNAPMIRPASSFQSICLPAMLLVSIPYLIFLLVFRSDDSSKSVLLISITSMTILVAIRSIVIVAENKQLVSHSVTDSLTGLFNHRFFQDRATAELSRAKRYQTLLCYVIGDIDDFRFINNVYGHVVGDKVVQFIADSVRNNIRASDTIGRIGGDEFALLMPLTSPNEAYKVCQNIQKTLRQEASKKFQNIKVSISFGIAAYPHHSSQKEDLEKKADIALYWAKYNGKGRIGIYDKEEIKSLSAEERMRRIEQLSYANTIHALAAAVDARDHYTQDHSKHVAALALMMADKLGFKPERAQLLEKAALLHDIGKIGIPDSILNKNGPLTEKERRHMQEHPLISMKIISATAMKDIMPWVVSHHEHWDGNGYPYGIKGMKIPLEARILAICDMYDAMVSNRPYRKALSREISLSELQKEKGFKVDPWLADIFLELISEVNNTKVLE